jgi:hypothetical protein
MPGRNKQSIMLKSIELHQSSRTANALELDRHKETAVIDLECNKDSQQAENETRLQGSYNKDNDNQDTRLQCRQAAVFILDDGVAQDLETETNIRTEALQVLETGQRKRPPKAEWFFPSRKQQKRHRQLSKEYPAIEIGEVDAEGRLVLY